MDELDPVLRPREAAEGAFVLGGLAVVTEADAGREVDVLSDAVRSNGGEHESLFQLAFDPRDRSAKILMRRHFRRVTSHPYAYVGLATGSIHSQGEHPWAAARML